MTDALVAELRADAERISKKQGIDKELLSLWRAAETLLNLAVERDEARRELARVQIAYHTSYGLGSAWRKRAELAEKQLAEAVGVLTEIVAHGAMSREEFMMQGPAFACRKVEWIVSRARALLAQHQSPQSSKEDA